MKLAKKEAWSIIIILEKKLIDALEDQEIWIKHRQSGLKSPDKAVSRALQIEAMYEAEPSGSKGWSVQLYRSRRRMRIANLWSSESRIHMS